MQCGSLPVHERSARLRTSPHWPTRSCPAATTPMRPYPSGMGGTSCRLGAEITGGINKFSGRERSREHVKDSFQFRFGGPSVNQNRAHAQVSLPAASRSRSPLATPLYQPTLHCRRRDRPEPKLHFGRNVADNPLGCLLPSQSSLLSKLHDRRQPALDALDGRRIWPTMRGGGRNQHG